ncbi:MAG: hypothetical protein Q8O40_12080 [Chloroflexota bacterium]|nr:hypothetical protein [Chloroflexota bacterium]
MASPQRRGITYEKKQAQKHHGEHVGGPGQPDYTRESKKGEVKNWSAPVHSGVVLMAKQKGVAEIVSKNGFTKPAEELAKQLRIKLITPRKAR